jgi:hypothetical protein
MESDLHVFAITLDVDDDTVHQTTEDRLSIAVGGARGLPQGGDIRCDRRDPRPLLRLYWQGRVLAEAVVCFLELSCVAQGLLPALLQRGRDQAVRRVDGLIPSLRQVHLVLGALYLLLPMLHEPGTFALDVLPDLQT